MVGYPRIFNGEDCNALTWFSPAEEARLNQTADLINSRLAAAASAAGFSFANPTSRFVGHAVCDADEWINGLSNPICESYHPKASGHASGYTPVVSPLLTGAAVAVTAKVRGRRRRLGDEPGRAPAAVRRRGPHDRAGGLRRPRPHHARRRAPRERRLGAATARPSLIERFVAQQRRDRPPDGRAPCWMRRCGAASVAVGRQVA